MQVCVSSSARVHVNSIDMTGCASRTVGGLGFRLSEPKISVFISTVNSTLDIAPLKQPSIVLSVAKELGLPDNLSICVSSSFGKHIGLGYETQLNLCLLKGLFLLANKPFTSLEACRYRIGQISGIGSGSFFYGGFVVDGGYPCIKGNKKVLNGLHCERPAPVIFKNQFPVEWKVILAIPKSANSLSGESEAAFFDHITPICEKHAHELSYYILLGVLPALIEKDFTAFIESMTQICRLGTKPHEEELNAGLSGLLLRYLRKEYGFASVSSLGPSVFSFYRRMNDLDFLNKTFSECRLITTTVENSPMQITTNPEQIQNLYNNTQYSRSN